MPTINIENIAQLNELLTLDITVSESEYNIFLYLINKYDPIDARKRMYSKPFHSLPESLVGYELLTADMVWHEVIHHYIHRGARYIVFKDTPDLLHSIDQYGFMSPHVYDMRKAGSRVTKPNKSKSKQASKDDEWLIEPVKD